MNNINCAVYTDPFHFLREFKATGKTIFFIKKSKIKWTQDCIDVVFIFHSFMFLNGEMAKY